MTEFLTILIVAIGLSFDSFAVSLTSGLKLPKIVFIDAIKIAFSLAFFQAVMPVIGWLLGNTVKQHIVDVDHWIAFAILLFLGFKMVWDGLRISDEQDKNPMKLWVILGMSIATSIDALAVGLTFSFISMPIIMAAVIIGGVTFVFAMTGIFIGKKTGVRFGKIMEVFGGLILIGIGVKILIEHLNHHG